MQYNDYKAKKIILMKIFIWKSFFLAIKSSVLLTVTCHRFAQPAVNVIYHSTIALRRGIVLAKFKNINLSVLQHRHNGIKYTKWSSGSTETRKLIVKFKSKDLIMMSTLCNKRLDCISLHYKTRKSLSGKF